MITEILISTNQLLSADGVPDTRPTDPTRTGQETQESRCVHGAEHSKVPTQTTSSPGEGQSLRDFTDVHRPDNHLSPEGSLSMSLGESERSTGCSGPDGWQEIPPVARKRVIEDGDVVVIARETQAEGLDTRRTGEFERRRSVSEVYRRGRQAWQFHIDYTTLMQVCQVFVTTHDT